MKITIAAMTLTLVCGVVSADPVHTKEQVAKLAGIILDAKENEKYKGTFRLENLSFDPKERIWRFEASSGGLGYVDIFEIRDADGFYRLGRINNTSFGSAPPEFRIAPSLRKKIRELLRSFSEEKKPG